jgi:hypothetical protein
MEGPSDMGKPSAGPEEGGRMCTVRLKMHVSRPFFNQRLGLEDTPSRGKFLKEPLDLLIINPLSIA